MSKENRETISQYELVAERYLSLSGGKIKPWVKSWIKDGLKGIDRSAKILELGSASGRDARYIEGLGYSNLVVSDVVGVFLEHLEDMGFADVRKIDVLADDLGGGWEAIYASAVFLHLRKSELKLALSKIYSALSDNGRLLFSVQSGDGEGWKVSEKGRRWFAYWTETELRVLLTEVGFGFIETRLSCEDDDGAAGKWIMLRADKIKGKEEDK